MNATIPEQVDSKLKDELQTLMGRMLEVLREILATVHEERLVFEGDHISGLPELLDRRHNLLSSFEDISHKFQGLLAFMSNPEEDASFFHTLELLQKYLMPEDVELLLLIDQLRCITKEMTSETNLLVHLLELKSGALYNRNLTPKKQSATSPRLAVQLADDE